MFAILFVTSFDNFHARDPRESLHCITDAWGLKVALFLRLSYPFDLCVRIPSEEKLSNVSLGSFQMASGAGPFTGASAGAVGAMRATTLPPTQQQSQAMPWPFAARPFHRRYDRQRTPDGGGARHSLTSHTSPHSPTRSRTPTNHSTHSLTL